MVKKYRRWLWVLVLIAVLTAIDQLTKLWAVEYLKEGALVIWQNIFELHYVKNDGMAWGLFSEGQFFFLILTPILVLMFFYIIYKAPDQKRYRPLVQTMTVLIAGALGNYIDRFVNGYVHDFLYFKMINFPVFNIADCYIVVAGIFFILLFFFYYKEEDLEVFLPRFFKAKKENGTNL